MIRFRLQTRCQRGKAKQVIASVCCLVFGCAIGPFALASTATSTASGEAGIGQIVVSMAGLLQLTRKIAPEGTLVTSFVPAGAAPETFEPTPALVSNLAKARFYVASGAPFERVWLSRIRANHPRLVIIDAFALEGAALSGKRSSSLHEHDPHLWLSPPMLKLAANRIAAGLMRESAEGSSGSQRNSGESGKSVKSIDDDLIAARLVQVKAEIDSIDGAVRQALGTAVQSKQKFFVFHPSWGEFAKVFGLEQVALEADGHAPSPADMQRFIAAMKAAKAKVIYAQPQFSTKDAHSAARHTGARVVMVDPLSEDQFGGLITFAQALRADFDERK